MRMMKAMVAALALVGFGAAQAQDEVVVRREPSAVGTIARSTLAGGVVGSAVAGGIILYEMEIQDNENYDWQETLAWGAGIGLAAGLVWGIVDAASGPDYAYGSAIPVRDGQSVSLDRKSMADPAGKAIFPVAMGRF